jgi:hypothetical protein
LNELERSRRAESAEIAQAANKPADDTALRRVVAASVLDISVRQGEPFVAALAAAKALAPDPEQLKPLDGLLHRVRAASLQRELSALVRCAAGAVIKPPAVMDRLRQARSSFRIERSDAVGNDRTP